MPIIPPSGYTDPQRVVTVFPDAELIVGRYLRDQLDTAANVVLSLADGQAFAPPVVRVQRIGGTWRIRHYLDEPMIDIDVWAVSYSSAVAVATSARAALAAMKGVHYLGAAITGVYEIAGPGRRPEDNVSLSRIGMTIGLLLHPV